MLTPVSYVTTPDGWGQDQGVWERAEFEGGSSIQFQNGPHTTRGVNGVADDDVLKVVVDHQRALQKARPSRARAQVITKLDEARQWDRTRAEQENTREKAVERAEGHNV